MAENKGLMSQLGAAAKNNPAVDKLRDEATGYLQARGKDLAKNPATSSRAPPTSSRTPPTTAGCSGRRPKNVAKGDNPARQRSRVPRWSEGQGQGQDHRRRVAAEAVAAPRPSRPRTSSEAIDIGAPVTWPTTSGPCCRRSRLHEEGRERRAGGRDQGRLQGPDLLIAPHLGGHHRGADPDELIHLALVGREGSRRRHGHLQRDRAAADAGDRGPRVPPAGVLRAAPATSGAPRVVGRARTSSTSGAT